MHFYSLVREATESSLIGTVVEDRYLVESQLGEGGMGCVYRGRHIKVGRTVAIKVLHDHFVQDPTMVARFEREAMIAARLKHRNLVPVIDLGTTVDGKKVMVLEFAPGASLFDLVGYPIPRARVIDLVRQLLDGLQHAHALGLVHRDLKPENVLVERTSDGHEIPRIVDFGIAVLRDGADSPDERRLTTQGLILGTPMYMSPEQAKGERVDSRTDLFALGVIVYQMVCGKPPFEGTGLEVMMQNLVQDPPSMATRTGFDVDPKLEAFARKLMARELDDRFQSATVALAELEQIATERQAVPEPIADRVTLRQRAQRVEMVALTSGTSPTLGSFTTPVGDSLPPPRRAVGAMLGAAAIVVAALIASIALTCLA